MMNLPRPNPEIHVVQYIRHHAPAVYNPLRNDIRLCNMKHMSEDKIIKILVHEFVHYAETMFVEDKDCILTIGISYYNADINGMRHITEEIADYITEE